MTEDELPPDGAWISREEQAVNTAIHTRHGVIPGRVEHRIVGVLAGRWPRLGRVRWIPSSDRDQTITEVTLLIGEDGSIQPIDPDEH